MIVLVITFFVIITVLCFFMIIVLVVFLVITMGFVFVVIALIIVLLVFLVIIMILFFPGHYGLVFCNSFNYICFLLCLLFMHLIIRRQQFYYLAHSCVLPSSRMLSNLSLKPFGVFNIHTLVLAQICWQTYLKVLLKFVTHLPYSCWNLNYSKLFSNKLCFSVFLSSFLNCSICCNPQVCFSFSIICPPFPFVFLL